MSKGYTAQNNDYVNFFTRVTMLALGVNAAAQAGNAMDKLFKAIGDPGPVKSSEFSTFYKITDLLDSTKKQKFFDDLATDICTGYQGILT